MSQSGSGWRNWGDHPIVVLIGVIAGVLAIVAFFTNKESKSESKNQNVSINQNASIKKQTSEFPDAPPDISAPILKEDILLSSENDCQPEGGIHTVTVVKAGQDDLSSTDAPFFILKDDRGVQQKYYLDDIPNSVSSWIPEIMVPGRRLKIKYVYCGVSGAIKILSYIETLKSH